MGVESWGWRLDRDGVFFFFQAEDGIRDVAVRVQTCALPIWAGEMSRAFVDQALAKGDECVGIFDGDMLTSIGWYARTPTPVTDSLSLRFDPSWTYIDRKSVV